MGTCLSSAQSHSATDQPTATVISVNGDLREYGLPSTVFQVLQMENSLSSSSFFLCNSDSLCYEEYAPAMDSGEELQAGQIYFVLPIAKLQYRLSASDMAALAVKASVALQKRSGSKKGKKKSRISPVLEGNQRVHESDSASDLDWLGKNTASLGKPAGLGVSRSAHVRKLRRYSSRRAKLAVRSFRLRLSTIYEGSVLQVY